MVAGSGGGDGGQSWLGRACVVTGKGSGWGRGSWMASDKHL